MVCWNEDDIVLQLSRFFYKELEKSEFKDKGIEFHTQMKISNDTFNTAYTFNGKTLNDIKSKFGRDLKPDFIITKEDDAFLWLIGEVKYFREWRSALKKRVEKDLDVLKEFKDKGVCIKTVYLLADDYLHKKDKKRWLELQEQLSGEKAKSIDFIDLNTMCSNRDCNEKNFAFSRKDRDPEDE